MIKPQALKKGDTIGIISPASPPNKENLKRSLSFLEETGLKFKLGKHIEREYGYLAGTDEERAEDIHTMFQDQEVKAIICACGGFGTARMASLLDYDLIQKNPKIFWGYSDITFLHTAIRQKTGLVTFHGPMLSSDFGEEAGVLPITKQYFHQLFENSPLTYNESLSPLEIMIEGKASGELVGGNLSLITSSVGTAFEIDSKEKLLLIEDIDEEPYAVDRMLNQLYMSGKLTDAAGILVADFHNCVPQKRKNSIPFDEVLAHYIKLAGKPALRGFKIGHCSPNISVPLGTHAEMNTFEKKVVIESGIL
ncbi:MULTISPECIES: S66 peptidase family protein [Metabacillus]|uniref:LD-carboxypeptidase n=1 Tax=Metabacillus hrfriensis TaxID=3048891 RepID=A0ACD4RG44_9BACI|nr:MULTISPECIES: LD-carboxypeptidase [Metabacillus]UAL53734.1 LD-carboxypeptidase [Metabacillus dongyingensis]USK30045.1 LD-carboxypeptidase [Bacillus sp. CMF21]WHZ59288.1 LD-carboxypeptidase [Metabacillus sp. CT-WN-B3]